MRQIRYASKYNFAMLYKLTFICFWSANSEITRYLRPTRGGRALLRPSNFTVLDFFFYLSLDCFTTGCSDIQRPLNSPCFHCHILKIAEMGQNLTKERQHFQNR